MWIGLVGWGLSEIEMYVISHGQSGMKWKMGTIELSSVRERGRFAVSWNSNRGERESNVTYKIKNISRECLVVFVSFLWS